MRGSRMGMAPWPESLSKSSELCSVARVMTMRFPARGDAKGSAKLTSYCFEDGLGAGFEEEAGDVFAKSGGLVWRCGGALADILRAVDGADAGFENKFAALDARPGAERNLAAALQRGE